MRLVTAEADQGPVPGLIAGGGEVILDLSQPWPGLPGYSDMLELIRSVEENPGTLDSLDSLSRPADGGSVDLSSAVREGKAFPLNRTRLLAPIPRPPKNVICVGRNYAAHIEEGDRASGVTESTPPVPIFFTKPPTAIIGPDAGIPYPAVTEALDYEVELAVVIGKEGRDLNREEVWDHIFGYTILNDVTARDLQDRHKQWFKGKGLDGTCPVGPWIVHRSSLDDPQALRVALKVNDELRQESNTRLMIFDIPTLLTTVSAGMTLEPGDIIATGTCEGCGFGFDPPRFLQPGDQIEAEVEGLGVLRNGVVSAKDGSQRGKQCG